MTNTFNWDNLLSSQRLGGNNKTDTQAFDSDNKTDTYHFDSDYKRIVTSPAFRRLQDKTQVFPLERNDFVHSRLTHSIEVAMIARELASNIVNYLEEHHKINNGYKAQICRVVENASLIHDIGNPPFGHFGEFIIRDWFIKNSEKLFTNNSKYLEDFINFEGNAQALRIITKLHNFHGDNGMNLTSATLNTIIKYTRGSNQKKNTDLITHKKIGFFLSEEDIFSTITSNTKVGLHRHPLTFILEAADDIAYLSADIEDAIEKELFTFDYFIESLKKYNEQYGNSTNNKYLMELINQYDKEKTTRHDFFLDIRIKLMSAAKFSFTRNYDKIMKGEYHKDLFHQSYSETLHDALGKFAREYIFINKNILKLEVSGASIINSLLDIFVNAILHHKDLTKIDNKFDEKIINLISTSHKKVYQYIFEQNKDKDDEDYLLYHRLLMITDFISGMTDSYAQDLYLTLSGHNS